MTVIASLNASRTVAAELKVFYGGTFDPIHCGHLAIARAARDALGCRVTFVPAADPPGRSAPGASALHRLRMVELAVADEPGIDADPCELWRAQQHPGPSYTIDTLEELRRRYGKSTPLAWLLGADAFATINHWYRWHDIIQAAHLVIADRPLNSARQRMMKAIVQSLMTTAVSTPEALRALPSGRLMWLHQPMSTVSATEVRAALATRARHWQTFVHPSVAKYIQAEQLYQPGVAFYSADVG